MNPYILCLIVLGILIAFYYFVENIVLSIKTGYHSDIRLYLQDIWHKIAAWIKGQTPPHQRTIKDYDAELADIRRKRHNWKVTHHFGPMNQWQCQELEDLNYEEIGVMMLKSAEHGGAFPPEVSEKLREADNED